MTESGRTVRQALALAALSAVIAAAAHLPLVKRFARGEFREAFFIQADYPGLRVITLAEAEDLWRSGEAAILDARRADLYAQGHVPRALSAPAGDAERGLPPFFERLPLEGALVIYCEGGDCQSSLALAKLLHEKGFKDIRVFDGGWAEWERAGLPAEKGDAQK